MRTDTVSGADGVQAKPAGGHIPGEAGLWIVLFGDLMVFAALFGSYLYGRGIDPGLFARSQDTLNRNFGAANTLVLLASSLLVVLAWRAVGSPTYRHLAPRLLLSAVACGVGFVAIKVCEYHEKLAAGVSPTTNAFYMYYFVLTGLHLVHVVIGLGVLATLWAMSRHRVLSPTQRAFVEGGACFWHLVDLLWIVIFPLVFLVRA